ncbi:hypothetical protein GCK72_020069 [Caenorhabditis remanei]|uniref:Uncharacterized protein n=1 Tax=Caenorhabditis remanei TaxID=31234 RepID=A0A6A5GG95_CAERE|nr:hypothetical protein GCK72_020069 [Caenorhabditis remanei]KAF1753512.1 hypothetical protein GCK72_020069 [Caenorhabditis remanei]
MDFSSPALPFQNIADYLTLEDKFILRQVNTATRDLVDNLNPKMTEMAIYCGMPVPKMKYLTSMMRNTKLRLKRLSIGQNQKTLPKIFKWLLPDLKHKVHTETFYSASVVLAAPLFAHLHPDTLRDVHLVVGKKSVESLQQIVESEPCKKLEKIFIQTYLTPNKFPFKSFEHLTKIKIQFFGVTCSHVIPVILKSFLNKAKQLQSLELTVGVHPFNIENILKSFNRPSMIVQTRLGEPAIRHYPIQGSNYIFEIEFERRRIYIERKL